MGSAGGTPIAVGTSRRRRVIVDVILLVANNGRVLLRERANTGYGDGAYEPPSGQLADRETIVETAIRVASDTGIVIGAENVSLAHVMHDVSGDGRIAFFLSVSGWAGLSTSPDAHWFEVGNLPTNMLDRARVALRNYAEGMRFSTYPAFDPAGTGGADGFHVASGSARSDGSNGSGGKELLGAGESHEANGIFGTEERRSRTGSQPRREGACSVRLPG